ncbi:MAG TPA: cystathionine gamma-synthase [Longimicrobiales bacterium]
MIRPARISAAFGVAAVGDLSLAHGGTLPDVHVAYAVHGDDAAPPVLVLGGISAGRRICPEPGGAPGWWPGVVGAGCGLDPARHRLIAVDYVGGRGESSQPRPGERWPAFGTADQATAIARLLDVLGIPVLHAAVGASYGGMVALALAERFPERVERVVAIGAAHRSHPLASAVRSVQRRIVRHGLDAGDPRRAVGIARALAITTYRTAAEFGERFAGPPGVDGGAVRLPVDDYLDHHAAAYAESFPAAAFLTISGSLDLHRVDPRRIRARCTVVSIDSDTLVPPEDSRALAAALGERATFVRVASPYGHDGFLKEPEAIGAIIAGALADGEAPAVGTPAPETHYAARARPGAAEACGATRAARAGIGADTQHGAVMPPIHLSSNFTFEGFGAKRAYDYTRSGNPTRDLLAAAIAELEGGAAGLVTPTGMAAVHVVLQLLRPGDLVVAAHDGYGGTYRLLRALARKHALDVAFVDLTGTAALDVIARRRPRLVWVETPSNPLLRITDIAAVAGAARAAGALCVADNTFLSPALQSPLAHGADIVVHSTTKYLNGHSDVVGGAIVARDAALAEELGWWANCIGATGSPFDSYLTLRGLRTLHARLRVHEENARAVVEFLNTRPCVRRVYYPGLASHPGHDVAARQQRGFGAMVSFELDGGVPAVRRFLDGLRHFTLAESLGGVESLVAHPATMTHAAMDPAAREAAGISDALLRLSVGIEAADDLVADLRAACERVEGG